MIDQKGMFNNIYKNLVTPILKKDVGIDAEYLTNFSLSLLIPAYQNCLSMLVFAYANQMDGDCKIIPRSTLNTICTLL